jgi:LuxR family maltose regulon positive regulatory protein
VPRSRLTGLLSQAVRHRITLVSAPAGSGKTVACVHWAAAAAKHHRVAWLTVDAADREPNRLWADIAAALAAPAIRPAPVIPPSRESADDLPHIALAGMRGLAGPVVLVLDDIHELADSPAISELDLLIQHAPPSLRLVLSGRFAPGLQLAKLRVAGDLATIGEAELACDQEEAKAYLDLLGLSAEPAEQAALLRSTEGWMTGLRLLALGGRDMSASQVAAEYLRDEILGRQSAHLQRFMLRASVADDLTADLARRLTGEPTSGKLLDRLSQENYFVYHSGGEHYRFHPFVRDMLAAELLRQSPEILTKLFSEAADWCATHGETAPAAGYAASAGHWARAARLLADGGVTGLLPQRAHELTAALGKLPANILRTDPAIAAAMAAARLCAGEADAASACLDQAERSVVNQPALKLWVTALRVMGETGREAAPVLGLARMLAQEHSVIASAPAERRPLGVLWTTLGTAALRLYDLPAACEALRQAERLFTEAGPTAMRDRARGWRALAEAFSGDLRAADAIVAGLPASTMTKCLGALAVAQCALDRDELAVATEFLDAARSFTFPALPGEPDPSLIGELISTRLRLADGDLSGARELLDRLKGHPDTDPGTIAMFAADIALQAGHIQPFDERQSLLVHGRIMLARGDCTGAFAAAQQCLDAAPSTRTLRDRVEALLLAATAQRRLGEQDAAGRLLERALALAEPHRLSRPFLNGGAPVRSAITVLVRPGSGVAGFAAAVLQRFAYQSPAVSHWPADKVALTDSELAVLRFLPSHLTNQEIADSLCLSVNTVKTHLQTVYRKLGVTSRRAAISRCERLCLL